MKPKALYISYLLKSGDKMPIEEKIQHSQEIPTGQGMLTIGFEREEDGWMLCAELPANNPTGDNEVEIIYSNSGQTLEFTGSEERIEEIVNALREAQNYPYQEQIQELLLAYEQPIATEYNGASNETQRKVGSGLVGVITALASYEPLLKHYAGQDQSYLHLFGSTVADDKASAGMEAVFVGIVVTLLVYGGLKSGQAAYNLITGNRNSTE